MLLQEGPRIDFQSEGGGGAKIVLCSVSSDAPPWGTPEGKTSYFGSLGLLRKCIPRRVFKEFYLCTTHVYLFRRKVEETWPTRPPPRLRESCSNGTHYNGLIGLQIQKVLRSTLDWWEGGGAMIKAPSQLLQQLILKRQLQKHYCR